MAYKKKPFKKNVEVPIEKTKAKPETLDMSLDARKARSKARNDAIRKVNE